MASRKRVKADSIMRILFSEDSDDATPMNHVTVKNLNLLKLL
jgi:hypothetical protein